MTKLLPATEGPLLFNETNLSSAWAKIFLHLVDHSGHQATPLILSLTGFGEDGLPQEDSTLTTALDRLLAAKQPAQRSIEDVAFTIFPQRMWKIAGYDRFKLYALYKAVFPRYQAMNRKGNNRGLYFERLISFGRGPENGNQLEWLISQHNSRDRVQVRKSMLQASIFDPERDHVPDAQLQFPCLQHVSFVPTDKGLVVNAFYATQQILIKGYGNYLGLAHLGAFVAKEMNMKLSRLNVTVGVAKFKGKDLSENPEELAALVAAARKCVGPDSQDTAEMEPN